MVRTVGGITSTVDTLLVRSMGATAAAYSDTVLDPSYRYHTVPSIPDTVLQVRVVLASIDTLTGDPVWGREVDTLLVATLVRHFPADTTWADVPTPQPVRHDTSWVDVPTPQPARYDTTWQAVPGVVTSLERQSIAEQVAGDSHNWLTGIRDAEAADTARKTAIDRAGVMAPDAQRVSRILAPNDAPDDVYNGNHMQVALIALVQDLIRENRALTARVDVLEASAHTH
jgi:hypothetical protein